MRYLSGFRLLENVQRAKALLTKMDIPLASPDYLKIREILKGHEGYVYWFTKLLYVDKQPWSEINSIWKIINDEKGTVSLFSKNIVDLESVEEFWDEYAKAQIKQRAKSIYNQFPATQKEFIDLENQDDVALLNTLAQDKSNLSVIKKISSFKSRKDLLDAINRFLKYKTEGQFDKLENRIKALGCPILYSNEDESIIICQVNYQQLNQLGGDTAWCIVRSKSTFDSYVATLLSRQFIIFLMDESGPKSKIGVTTSEYGMVTAHDKNDGYINQEEISKILRERGYTLGGLLPKKADIKYSMFGFIPVFVLLNVGYTKDEIVEHKKVFKANYGYHRGAGSKSDISYFTKEEIDKWSLLDRTELQISDLKTYTKEEIIKRKLLSRVTRITIDGLHSIGFDLKDIQKSVPLEVLPKDEGELISKLKGKTRKQVVATAMSSWLSPLNVEYDHRESVRDKIIKLYRIGPKDVPFEGLYGIMDRKFDSIWSVFSYFTNLGYEIDKKIIGIVVEKKGGYKKNIKTYSALLKQCDDDMLHTGLPTNVSSKNPKIKEYITDLLMSSIDTKEDDDLWSRSNDALNYDYTELTQMRDVYLVNYPDIYKLIYDKVRSWLIGKDIIKYRSRIGGEYREQESGRVKTYELQLKDKDRSGGMRDVNVDITIKNLEFFGFTQAEISLKDMSKIFHYASKYDWDKIVKYFHKMGYVISGREGFDTFTEIKSHNVDTIDFLAFCIENQILVDDCYDSLVSYVKSQTKSLKDYEKSRVKGLLQKSDKYKDEWENQEKRDKYNEALEVTIKSSKYWSTGGGNYTALTPEKWYEKYFDYVKDIDFNNIGRNREAFKYALGALFMLAKLNKPENFDKIKFDFIYSKGDWTLHDGRTCLTDLCKVITNKHITNWRMTWNLELGPSERKMLYDWLDKKTTPMLKDWEEDIERIEQQMQVCYYLYDKEKFKKLVEKIKKTKNNRTYVTTSRKTKQEIEKTYTNRLADLKPVIAYMAEEGRFDDLRSLISEFVNARMGKEEKKLSKEFINRLYMHFSRNPGDKDDVISSRGAQESNRKKVKEITDELLSTTVVKESRILRWSEFN